VLARRSGVGVRLEPDWFCSTACLELAAVERMDAARPRAAVRRPTAIPPLKLGMLLVAHGVLTPAQIQEALEAQRASGLRLGAQIEQLRLAPTTEVVRALAVQSGAPWLASLDPAQARVVPEILGHDAVRALGLVPFDIDARRHRVKVACAAPVPRLALGAFSELTRWIADPFVVSDDQMRRLLAACERHAAQTMDGAETRGPVSVRAAARHIARTAAQGGGASVAQAACDPYLWVRVESRAGADDLFVRPGTQEQTWQAEHTLH
jgi:type IV pilus assembly protein PilB